MCQLMIIILNIMHFRQIARILKNSATIFQKFINAVFRDHIAICLDLNNH